MIVKAVSRLWGGAVRMGMVRRLCELRSLRRQVAAFCGGLQPVGLEEGGLGPGELEQAWGGRG